MIVVDTNVIVDALRGLPAAVDVLGRHFGGDFVVPSIVRYEVLAGARPHELPVVLGLLDAFLDAPADAAVADEAAELTRRYSRSHSGIDPVDYLIAATARLLDARLLTRNVKHFPMFSGLTAPY